jgi:uncharacterized protein (UPF0548 family)
MSLTLDEISAITRAAALEHGRAVEVAGVTSAETGSNRVEILINIAGCAREPCRFVLNVNRSDRAQFERELRQKLRDAISARQ